MFRARKQSRRSCAAAIAGSSACTAMDLGPKKRDWAQLLPELVREIGDDLLRDDATEYIRLRAVCQPWRRATDDPSALEPRFFPRNWLMLKLGLKLRTDGEAERFVNVRSGAFLQIRLPTPGFYSYHGSTEGLLVLHHPMTDTVCLLNPLTMAFTDLPSIRSIDHGHVPENSAQFAPRHIKAAGVIVEADEQGRAQGPANVVLTLTKRARTVLVYARPRDFVWQLVDTSCTDEIEGKLPTIKRGLSVWGRFYIPTRGGDVLTMVLEPRPHLTLVARPIGRSVCSGLSETSYLVPNFDDRKEGMLLVRKEFRGCRETYLTWEVDVTNRRLIRVIALRDMTVMLPSATLRSSAFPTILQNRVCSKNYMKRLLRGNLI